MPLRTISTADLSGKRVLCRVDFNVPLKDGLVHDDTRILAAIPTIRTILTKGASLVLMSHLGRPQGKRQKDLSLTPVANKLSDLLDQEVQLAPDCIGFKVEEMAAGLRMGSVLLLENLRWYEGEEKNDPDFVDALATLGDVFVNDAFGSVHRAHASTEGIAHKMPAYAGLLIEKELRFLEPFVKEPPQPMLAIVGGSKVSSKIAILENLLSKCTTLIIGGGMSYTFLKSQGYSIGTSLLEEEHLETAKRLIKRAAELNVELLLPVDHVVSEHFGTQGIPEVVDGSNIPEGKIAMDIGPRSISRSVEAVHSAKSIIWNGPVGVFEFDSFDRGTRAIAEAIADAEAISVVGGGDTVSALNKFALASRMSHVSTGGGASLEFLEGKKLPGLVTLQD